MWRALTYCLVFFLAQTTGFAGDFLAEFVQENYKETRKAFSYSPVIYHSIQVRSAAGPKLIILRGDDDQYRKWLRRYIAEDMGLILKVPDDENDLFVSSHAFEMDVTRIHPLNLRSFRAAEAENRAAREPGQLNSGGYGPQPLGNRKKIPGDKEGLEKEKRERQALARSQKKDARAGDDARQKARAAAEEENRLKKEALLKAMADREAVDREKLQQALEQERRERERRVAALADQRALEAQRRREQLEQRWLELKARLMEDERIKAMEISVRNREIQRRWLELKQRFEAQ
jgi:hypothetical protein